MTMNTAVAGLALAGLVTALTPMPAEAGRPLGHVTAYSDYGNGQVTAPVRRAEFGYQVKLPGGPWIYCQRNSLFIARILEYASPCSDTLRRQSLDFWETQSEDQGGPR
ncbi:MAG: hypothetical protein AAGF14_08815 [Pseudomonadota bacterium]